MATDSRGAGFVYRRGNRWWVSIYVNGKEHREPGGLTEKEAQAKLKKRRKEKYAETFVGRAQEKLTVNELLDAYHVNRELALVGNMKNLRSAIKTLREGFGSVKAMDIRLPRLEQWAVEKAKSGVAPGTIKHRLGIMAAAFKVTRRQGLHTYTPDFPQIKTPPARQGFFEPEVFERVWRALPAPLDDVALFAYSSGWRKQEVLGLRWSEVDQAAGIITLPAERTKTQRSRSLAVVGAIAEVIARRSAQGVCAWVFHRDGQPVRSLDKAWRSACETAGVPDRLFHDLRRTFVRDAENANVPRSSGKAVTGHASDDIYGRYAIRNVRDVATAMLAVETYRRTLRAARDPDVTRTATAAEVTASTT